MERLGLKPLERSRLEAGPQALGFRIKGLGFRIKV